jgi:phosphoribulokinase
MNFSHFGPESTFFQELETLFRVYGARGTAKVRKYLHNEEEAAPHKQKRVLHAVGGHSARQRPKMNRVLKVDEVNPK